MKPFILFLIFLQVLNAQLIERNPVPADIINNAKVAVSKLTTEILKENYNYSFDTMYQRSKKTAALNAGGEEELKKIFTEIPLKMKAQGIDILDIKVGKPTKSFEVRPAHFQDSSKTPVFTEYIVFVPTSKIIRVIDPNSGVVKKLKIDGYQIAVRHIDSQIWSFIDGSTLSLRQLRDLFPSLPEKKQELGIPKTGMSEVK